MPKLQELHEQFEKEGVKVFGISTWERGDPVKLMTEKQLTYQLLLNGEKITEEYSLSALPTIYIIGTDGKIIHNALGYDPKKFDEFVKIVEKALKSK